MNFSNLLQKYFLKKCGLPQKSGLNLQTNAENVVQRFYKFIVAFCLIVYGPEVLAQDFSKKIPMIRMIGPTPLIKFSIHTARKFPVLHFDPVKEWYSGQGVTVIKNHAVTSSIAGNFYTQNFGFMCKSELHLQKSTGVPLRFRLGSLQYCDAMEGKGDR
jgi:hypothetical protein